MSKALLCNNCLSYRKDIILFWLVLFPIILPNKSVIFIPSILKTVVSLGRPGGIDVLFLTIPRKLFLITHLLLLEVVGPLVISFDSDVHIYVIM